MRTTSTASTRTTSGAGRRATTRPTTMSCRARGRGASLTTCAASCPRPATGEATNRAALRNHLARVEVSVTTSYAAAIGRISAASPTRADGDWDQRSRRQCDVGDCGFCTSTTCPTAAGVAAPPPQAQTVLVEVKSLGTVQLPVAVIKTVFELGGGGAAAGFFPPNTLSSAPRAELASATASRPAMSTLRRISYRHLCS